MARELPTVVGVQHRFVTVGDLQFHYAEAGQGEPLVLLHGFPQHWYVWRHQIPALAKRYRVICPDLRGSGWSDAPRGGYEKERLAADIVALLDAIGVRQFRLMGHDWGGWLGFIICLRHPQRVIRFIALNVPHVYQRLDSRIFTWWRLWYQSVIATPWLGYLLIRRTSFIRFLMHLGKSRHLWRDEDLREYLAPLKEPARAMAGIKLYRTYLLRESIATLYKYRRHRLTVPTLMLFGTSDPFVSRKLLDGYEPYADQMSVEFVPDCGHFIVEERADLVAKRAAEFFAINEDR